MDFEGVGLITREHALYAAQNAVRQQGYAVAVPAARWGFDTWYIDLSVMPRRRWRR